MSLAISPFEHGSFYLCLFGRFQIADVKLACDFCPKVFPIIILRTTTLMGRFGYWDCAHDARRVCGLIFPQFSNEKVNSPWLDSNSGASDLIFIDPGKWRFA